ncbi:MAG: protein O-GlcNAcase [Acidimicrobiales bacterium]|nr:protein O-GlcNAcase [Acidimicrobiales bacterium]
MSTWSIRGVIEGFYGPPWDWDHRKALMHWCYERGMTHYVYAPKDDPLHRERWRDPYPKQTLERFADLVASNTLEVGFAISPGLSINYHSSDDRQQLFAKLDQVTELGIALVALLLDDIPVRPGLGADHAELTQRLRDYLGDEIQLVLVPTEYTGTAPSPYLDALAAGVPDDVAIAWTGPTVVCDAITATMARQRASVLGDRPPLLWDNYPVNDGMMADRLFLGPLRGRDPALRNECWGYLANPMVQPVASKLPLASIAAFCRGEDPLQAWEQEASALGWRVLAESCDGTEPWRLVAQLADSLARGDPAQSLAALVNWLREAKACEAPGLEAEAAEWIDQTHTEASCALVAARVIQACQTLRIVDRDGSARVAPPHRKGVAENAMALSFIWPAARRGTRSVFGPRASFRPVLSQWPDGEWRVHADCLSAHHNALDWLVELALAECERLASNPNPPPTISVAHRDELPLPDSRLS